MCSDSEITLIGRTNFRSDRRLFGIRSADRRAHMYIVGKTGTGKSTLLEVLVRQDMHAGHGLALLDPHGDLVERVLACVPVHRQTDVTYFDATDIARPLGFNPLERVAPPKRPVVALGLLDVFRKIWADFWGPRLEHILRNALLTLLDQPQATLGDISRLLDDRTYRHNAALRVANSQVRRFWLHEYEGYPARFRAEAVAPIRNKVGAFLTNPLLNSILSQPRSAFDLRRIMDERKILLVNLAKGKIGEDTAALLGAMLVSRLGFTGLSRADTPESERRDFYVYLDEFQTFTTQSLSGMLSELRKYRANLILANQFLSQVSQPVRESILGNIGSLISFRVGAPDAELLAEEFRPEFSAADLVSLPNYSIYLKLMVEGVVSRPFSAETLELGRGTRQDGPEETT